jgi:hypothetical protein
MIRWSVGSKSFNPSIIQFAQKKEAGTFGPTSSIQTKYFSYTRFSLIRAFLPVRARK